MTADQKSELIKKHWLKMPELEYLNISYNKIGSELMEVLMGPNFGIFSSSIETLNMVEVDINDKFISKVFSKQLATLGHSLRECDLSHNLIGNSYPLLMSSFQQHSPGL